MAVARKAPYRKIVEIDSGFPGAVLECGHKKVVRYGQKKARCEDCLRRASQAIKRVRARVALRCQQRMRKKVWAKITNKDFSHVWNIIEILDWKIQGHRYDNYDDIAF